MTVLDIVDRYPQTEKVFRKYDREAGVCLCCQALFESLRGMAEKYDLNLEMLLEGLNATPDPFKESGKGGTTISSNIGKQENAYLRGKTWISRKFFD